MFLLNLSLGELMALVTAVSGIAFALYLLDRSKRRMTVSTLRFWESARHPVPLQNRKRIQQPWSLLLQILSMILLLLAIAQLRFGSQETGARDHVLILDSSAWMAARSGAGTLMDEARARARSYLKALPDGDRVMLLRADALATPATRFESSRARVDEAIFRTQPSSSALNVDQALQFAQQALRLQGRRAGEIVYAGAGRISGVESADTVRQLPQNLRVLPVKGSVENCGLRKIAVRRSTEDPEVWDIFVAVRNYGVSERTLGLALRFGGAPVASKQIVLKAGSEQEFSFSWRTRAAGWLEARLLTRDAFPGDDRALLELPEQKPLRVGVYTAEPELLRPLLGQNPSLEARFHSFAEYKPDSGEDIVILDRLAPPVPPKSATLWIEPPQGKTPFSVGPESAGSKLTHWNTDDSIAHGLRASDIDLGMAEILRPAAGDIVVGESAAGPVVLARPGSPRQMALGFHPIRSAMKYELATPLLFANGFHWLVPSAFRRWEVQAGAVGTVSVNLEPGTDTGSIRVMTEDGQDLPFTVQSNTLRLFSGTPGVVRVLTADREQVYSMTLPEVPDADWKLPAEVRRGVPSFTANAAGSIDLWQWLATLGGAGLLADWLLFGRRRSAKANVPGFRVNMPWRKAS